jgi:hypothetical protein
MIFISTRCLKITVVRMLAFLSKIVFGLKDGFQFSLNYHVLSIDVNWMSGPGTSLEFGEIMMSCVTRRLPV